MMEEEFSVDFVLRGGSLSGRDPPYDRPPTFPGARIEWVGPCRRHQTPTDKKLTSRTRSIGEQRADAPNAPTHPTRPTRPHAPDRIRSPLTPPPPSGLVDHQVEERIPRLIGVGAAAHSGVERVDPREILHRQ